MKHHSKACLLPLYLRSIEHTLPVLAITLFAPLLLDAQLQLRTGDEIYREACIGCHGPHGEGQPKVVVGFDPPQTMPDFTKCDQTTPEFNRDYKAVIRDGGPERAFSQIMPSFRDA